MIDKKTTHCFQERERHKTKKGGRGVKKSTFVFLVLVKEEKFWRKKNEEKKNGTSKRKKKKTESHIFIRTNRK